MNATENWVEQIGEPAYSSIECLVAALQCDYDRLEELRDERINLVDELEEFDKEEDKEERRAAAKAIKEWEEENAEELAELESAAIGCDANYPCENEEQARERIEEDALSVEVRSDWHTIGEQGEDSEFCILLTTGGPAVRIRGTLDSGEPCRAWLEVQDWGKPWTQYHGADQGVLLAYASVFYFGQ